MLGWAERKKERYWERKGGGGFGFGRLGGHKLCLDGQRRKKNHGGEMGYEMIGGLGVGGVGRVGWEGIDLNCMGREMVEKWAMKGLWGRWLGGGRAQTLLSWTERGENDGREMGQEDSWGRNTWNSLEMGYMNGDLGVRWMRG